jgi:hypothetical protein
MADFEIEQYTVLATQQGTSPSWRSLALESKPLAHNIRHHAVLYFFEATLTTLGSVTNVDQANFNGHTIYAFLRKSDFAEIYDVLRSEKPVRLYYHYPTGFDPQRPTRPLEAIQIGTGAEPPGEGPEDVSPGTGAEQPGEGSEKMGGASVS